MVRSIQTWMIIISCVSMSTHVLGQNMASQLCGDKTGYNCFFKSNTKEMDNVPVTFSSGLPSWLIGTLVRNGVGLFEVGNQSTTHVFDGFAKLSSWKFFPNRTTVFSTRFIGSNCYTKSIQENKLAPYILFSPPKPKFSIVEKALCLVNGVDNMDVNIYEFPQKLKNPNFAALSDTWNAYQVSIDDLSTVKHVKPRVSWKHVLLKSTLMSSAHPLPEPGTMNRLTFLSDSNSLTLVRMTSISDRQKVAEWRIGGGVPYMHSFSVTDTKAIFLAGPFRYDPVCITLNASPLPCMKWNASQPTNLYIADIKTGDNTTITIPQAMFALHHINAYDVNDQELILDVTAYDSPVNLNEELLLNVIKNDTKRTQFFQIPKNKRILINHVTSSVNITNMSPTSLSRDNLEMPVINELYRYKKYCYVYGLASFADGVNFTSTSVIKKNMCKRGKIEGSLLFYQHYPSEAFFVANPKGVSEDDGVLLVPFLRGEDAVSYLAVVDAKTMKVISKADAPTYIPFSIHGRFFNNFQLGAVNAISNSVI